MDFGIQRFPPTPPGAEVGDHLSAILDKLPLAFTTVWLPDHLQFGSEPVLEAWASLAYLAGRNRRFRFGHLVLAQSYRNPGLVAKMATTLAVLSGGRYVLGLGAGWKEDEYVAYGYDFPSGATRVEQLGEAIQVIRALLTESPATYKGQHYHAVRARCEPRPSSAIPILVGTNGPRALRVVARYADWWNWDGPWANYERPYQDLKAACDDIGRPFSDIVLTAGVDVDFRDVTSRSSITLGPDPRTIIDELALLERVGVRHVQIGFDDSASIDRFVAEVLPAFASTPARDGEGRSAGHERS